MEITKFFKYSAILFFTLILFLPINSEMWKPLGIAGFISGIMWIKNIIF